MLLTCLTILSAVAAVLICVLAGVSFWNLNALFRTNFLVLESMYTVEKL